MCSEAVWRRRRQCCGLRPVSRLGCKRKHCPLLLLASDRVQEYTLLSPDTRHTETVTLLQPGTMATMRAVLLTAKPAARADITQHLAVAEAVPVPEVKADQVLVRVRATSLNIEDIMWGVGRRVGVYITATKEAPVILGQEFSGVVERVGAKVMKFKIGDAVLGHKVDILQITRIMRSIFLSS